MATTTSKASSSTDLITVLTDVTFQEQIQELASFLSRSKPEAERDAYVEKFSTSAAGAEAEGASQEKQFQVVESIVAEVNGPGEGSDREIEGAFNLLIALIFSSTSEEASQTQLLSKIAASVGREGSTEKVAVRYRILSNIFNSLPSNSAFRLTIFNNLLDLASSNDELDLLSESLSSISSWLAIWQVSSSEKAKCLEKISEKLAAADQGAKAYEFQLLFLRYIKSESSDEATIKEAATKTIASALRLPNLFDFDELFQVENVQKLKGTSIFELLNIFVGGDLSDYKKWEASHKAELEKLNLSSAALDKKIRLLDLASLCAKTKSEVSYKEIASTIQINESEVEIWVIDVIRAGLVSGKLSQVQQIFRVYRTSHRTFGEEQWRTLESRLVEWQGSINNIIQAIASSKGGAVPALAADNGAVAA